MNFQAAYAYMKRGYAITLPEWGGYWTWDADEETVLLHCRNGDVLDIRDTDAVDYTIQFMFRQDWYIEEEVEDTDHDVNAAIRDEEDILADLALLDEMIEDAACCGCEECLDFLEQYNAALDEDDDDDDDIDFDGTAPEIVVVVLA